MVRGRFITIEGGEGAGKSTQVRRLAAWLGDAGKDVLATREPGGSPGAEVIRELLVTGEVGRWPPVTEALLHYAARRDHLDRVIEPALAAGRWVISDRYADSTMAYQGYAQHLGRPWVEALHRLAAGAVTPDLTLILDLPVAAGLQRAVARSGSEDRYERMDTTFHHTLRAAFQDIAAREPERCIVVDGQGAPDAVHQRITSVVGERLGIAS